MTPHDFRSRETTQHEADRLASRWAQGVNGKKRSTINSEVLYIRVPIPSHPNGSTFIPLDLSA